MTEHSDYERFVGRVLRAGSRAPLAVLLERQLTQADKFGGLVEESVGIHAGWEYDLTIDTSSHRPSEATRVLTEFLSLATDARP